MPIILILIGLVLVIYNYIALKKESIPFEIHDNEEKLKKNNSFENVLEKSKDELNEYKIELGVFRKNVAESLTELQEEILEIKKYLNIIKNNENLYEDKIEKENLIIEEDSFYNKFDNNVISEINFNNNSMKRKSSDTEKIADSKKTEKIKELLNEGLSEEEICHRLSISKGEVLLVKDLYKK